MEIKNKTTRFLPEERETHLWYDPIDHIWRLESNIPKHFNKAVRQGWNIISKAVYDDGTVCAMNLTAPEGAITIRNPNKKRKMSSKAMEALHGVENDELDDDFLEE